MNFWNIFLVVRKMFTAASLLNSQISPPTNGHTDSLGYPQFPSAKNTDKLTALLAMMKKVENWGNSPREKSKKKYKNEGYWKL